jgi:diguanylate cyclase (GGDEF)-like protein
MAREGELAAVLAEFARTMVTNFPIQSILDHLVVRIVDILPVTSAGVTLIEAGIPPRYIAASDADALMYERLQSEIGEGPCVQASTSGELVSVPDLRQERRWPEFGSAALAGGLAAVFTFPLRHGDRQVGALDLYRNVPGLLGADDLSVAQTLADVAAAYLLNAQAREETQATSARFLHSATHDPLTGLPNRALLQQRLDHAAARAHRSRGTAAILFVDLDRFKDINDSHGHGVGDQLLIAASDRLSRLIRPGDTLARVSGDEFVFLCEDLIAADEAERLAQRITAAFRAPFTLDTLELQITASVGLAFAGTASEMTDQLVVDADLAMYEAKRAGGAGHQIYDLRAVLRHQAHASLEADMRQALGNNDLSVAYQPVTNSTEGAVVGVEALLRWTHPDRGVISPLTAIGVAERTGLIHDLGAWVLHRACADRQWWLAQHPDTPIKISVNVSPRQLMGPGFTDVVRAVLAQTRMDPSALVLEITESSFIEDLDRTLTVMNNLRADGIRFALDDFGTGYSSLSYLRRLPIDILKIDRSFITELSHVPSGADIVAAITNLAHVLNLTVCAEGVETQTQYNQVTAIGCDLVQGFLIARPMPADALMTWLHTEPNPITWTAADSVSTSNPTTDRRS